MIELSRLDGSKFVLNAMLIETIEARPDTVIVLTTGHHYVVREPVDQVIRQVVAFHRAICANDRASQQTRTAARDEVQ